MARPKGYVVTPPDLELIKERPDLNRARMTRPVLMQLWLDWFAVTVPKGREVPLTVTENFQSFPFDVTGMTRYTPSLYIHDWDIYLDMERELAHEVRGIPLAETEQVRARRLARFEIANQTDDIVIAVFGDPYSHGFMWWNGDEEEVMTWEQIEDTFSGRKSKPGLQFDWFRGRPSFQHVGVRIQRGKLLDHWQDRLPTWDDEAKEIAYFREPFSLWTPHSRIAPAFYFTVQNVLLEIDDGRPKEKVSQERRWKAFCWLAQNPRRVRWELQLNHDAPEMGDEVIRNYLVRNDFIDQRSRVMKKNFLPRFVIAYGMFPGVMVCELTVGDNGLDVTEVSWEDLGLNKIAEIGFGEDPALSARAYGQERQVIYNAGSRGRGRRYAEDRAPDRPYQEKPKEPARHVMGITLPEYPAEDYDGLMQGTKDALRKGDPDLLLEQLGKELISVEVMEEYGNKELVRGRRLWIEECIRVLTSTASEEQERVSAQEAKELRRQQLLEELAALDASSS